MRTAASSPDVLRPASVGEAVKALAELGGDGAPLAGGTWISRARLRGESMRSTYVSLHGLPELRGVEMNGVARIGALVTHAELAAVGGPPALRGIAAAACLSAFPAIRSVATVAGNIAASPFPEADLVPALLAAEARVVLVSLTGAAGEGLAGLLGTPVRSFGDRLITAIEVPIPSSRRSAYQRLTIRGGAEYPVASVAISVDLDGEGMITTARIAVGSVESIARLCPAASELLVGRRLDGSIEDAGRALAAECTGREGLDAPGWYRLAVLPALLRRAFADLSRQEE